MSEFRPTENQLRALCAFQEREYKGPIHAAMEKIGMSRRMWYYWFDDPAFETWWVAEAERFFGRQLPKIQAALLDAATHPKDRNDKRIDTRAAEILLQRFDKGFAPRSHQIIDADCKIGVDSQKTLELIDGIIRTSQQEGD